MTDEKLPIEALSAHPVELYGCGISYFTGKMENYFKLRGIAYELKDMPFPGFKKRMEKAVGVMQMPAVILPDGRWMTDTTKMIQLFEAQLPGDGLIPDDPRQAFFCYLIEDWADEWLWRPAMHYRWHYREGARFASDYLASHLLQSMMAPLWMKRARLTMRQRNGYTVGDGITRDNVAHVESGFMKTLAILEAIFAKRQFLLGARPSLADIGLSGPFFRHFALDPVPAEILRQHAPHVLAWVTRLWRTRLSDGVAPWPEAWEDTLPDDLAPLLEDISKTHLAYLCANVEAVKAGQKRFDADIDGTFYKAARYSQYRVWCLKELRAHFQAMPEDAQADTRAMLQKTGCWEPLWRHSELPMADDQEKNLPFHADSKMVGVNET